MLPDVFVQVGRVWQSHGSLGTARPDIEETDERYERPRDRLSEEAGDRMPGGRGVEEEEDYVEGLHIWPGPSLP